MSLCQAPAVDRLAATWRALALLVLVPVAAACGGRSGSAGAGGVEAAPAGDDGRGRPAAADSGADFARLGDGFLVWESNRTGPWRIWTRRLDGSGLAQLTPDEPGRQHCCPHISPDGAWVSYVSFSGGDEYPAAGVTGALRLLHPDGSGERQLAAAARTYFEDRAVVWRSATELVFIDGTGRSVLHDLDAGTTRRLTDEPLPRYGWLIDPTLRWAVDGTVRFSPYDAARRAVAPRAPLGGCQPYFSGDGRWGFWVAGAGGPIDRLDLESGEITTLLRRGDDHLPAARSYAYFPMASRDGRLFAVAASDGDHDHFRADYDVFVLAADPRTLELAGPAVRYTDDPATDRFPDVFAAPLALGRHTGEAPLTVTFAPPAPGVWRFELGDGTVAEGAGVTHTYPRAGSFRVLARRGRESAGGLVLVAPAAAPRVVGVTLARGGAAVEVRFDEPVELSGARVSFASGRAVARVEPGPSGRALLVTPSAPLTGADELLVEGVRDRAAPSNVMPPARLAIEPPLWPSRRDGLVFLWESAEMPNLVWDDRLGAQRACNLESRGLARLDHAWRMVTGGGYFLAGEESAALVHAACRASNELAIEAMVEPDAVAGAAGEVAAIVALGESGRGESFRLGQRGDRLVLRLRTGARGPEAVEEVELGRLPPGRASHVAVSYSPGRLAAWLDGEPLATGASPRGDFFHWRPYPLGLGALPGGGASWSGRLEGVAIYDRQLAPEEVAENALRYRQRLARRPPVARREVEAVVERVSRAPDLRQISPYREALVVFEYRVVGSGAGAAPERLRVARWAILDGRTLPAAAARAGERHHLILEPFAANPQLASLFLAETLGGGDRGPLYYAVDP